MNPTAGQSTRFVARIKREDISADLPIFPVDKKRFEMLEKDQWGVPIYVYLYRGKPHFWPAPRPGYCEIVDLEQEKVE